MVEEIKDEVVEEDEVVKDVREMTAEEKAAAWADWIKSDVLNHINAFIPLAKDSNIGIQYVPHVVEELEGGNEIDASKADAVFIVVRFGFEEPIDLTKPRIEDAEEEEAKEE